MFEQTTDLIPMAKRELSAFMTAVAELYGPEQAEQSADDWLNELESTNATTLLAVNAWRSITIASAARLANRLDSSLTDTKVSPIPSSNCSGRTRLA